jgi:hypothetical protein
VATWRKQTEEDYKHLEKSSYNFEGNSRPNYTPTIPKTKETMQIQSQLNDYWTNLHKN